VKEKCGIMFIVFGGNFVNFMTKKMKDNIYKQLLMRFLKQQDINYFLYYKTRVKIESLNSFLYNPSILIFNAFVWPNQEWGVIHKKWLKTLNKLENDN
jgi:hypothetical protein